MTLRGRVRTWWRTRDLPEQLDLLEELRDQDEYLLIVLDACRWDDFRGISELSLDADSQPVRSAGRDTFEYAMECWSGQYPETTYVSGATPIGSDGGLDFDDGGVRSLYDGYRPDEHIGEIVDVWATGWDDGLGTVTPEIVVDETIQRLDEDRLVCHLFQPHAPYIGDVELLGHSSDGSSTPGDGEPVDAPIWEQVRNGDIPRIGLCNAYRSNLSRAMSAVCWLVEEADRQVVIMGDHGEALGEYGIYAHPRLEHPKIRVVPWCPVDGLSKAGRARAELARERFDIAKTTLCQSRQHSDQKDILEDLGYL